MNPALAIIGILAIWTVACLVHDLISQYRTHARRNRRNRAALMRDFRGSNINRN